MALLLDFDSLAVVLDELGLIGGGSGVRLLNNFEDALFLSFNFLVLFSLKNGFNFAVFFDLDVLLFILRLFQFSVPDPIHKLLYVDI